MAQQSAKCAFLGKARFQKENVALIKLLLYYILSSIRNPSEDTSQARLERMLNPAHRPRTHSTDIGYRLPSAACVAMATKAPLSPGGRPGPTVRSAVKAREGATGMHPDGEHFRHPLTSFPVRQTGYKAARKVPEQATQDTT